MLPFPTGIASSVVLQILYLRFAIIIPDVQAIFDHGGRWILVDD
jgi:hypothetical protein